MFDDQHAAATALIDAGDTAADPLAIMVASSLASYKHPKEIVFVTERLPRNDTGKIQRAELERRAADTGPTTGAM